MQPLKHRLKIHSFSGDFHLKIGAVLDSRSHFGQVAGICNARMTDFLKVCVKGTLYLSALLVDY